MIGIRTRPVNTRPVRASTERFGPELTAEGLNRMSSMRAALNSKYCMRAQLKARNLVNGQADEQSNGEYFSYQEGQHRVVSNKLHLPEEIKITKTQHGKRWTTSSMEVELAKDILEVRDGLGKVVDAMVFKPKL